MRLPVTQLDDRSFDDLVAEARERLKRHLPDAAPLSDGDPVMALVDLFAFMTESVLFRANLIPERQRQAFLNLLQIPLRPARPARGLVSIDAKPRRGRLDLPPLLRPETGLRAGATIFTTDGELQPMPLALKAMIKEALDDDALRAAGLSRAILAEQYLRPVAPFRPRSFTEPGDAPNAAGSIDGYLYLLLHLPEARLAAEAPTLRQALAGQVLNVGLSPPRDVPGEIAEELEPRRLVWELAFQREAGGEPTWLPLEVVDDRSDGGRCAGVVRLRLPRSADTLASTFAEDPRQAGLGTRPPEPPAGVEAGQVMLWLRLSAPGEETLSFGHVDVNAVAVTGQGIERGDIVGTGDGRAGQAVSLGHSDVEPASLVLEVAEGGAFLPWQRVAHFAAAGPEDRVYRLDPRAGVVTFGDGMRGMRPPPAAPIRAAVYRHGGGPAGNLPAGSLRTVDADPALYAVRQPTAMTGGVAAETVAEAEQRIPAFLTHRGRAVTEADFTVLARDNPVAPVARAEAVAGFVPGARLGAARTDVPGAVSVFVLPPATPAMAAAPRPTAGLLRDVFGWLEPRKTLSTELYVLSPEFTEVALSVAMTPVDPRAGAGVAAEMRATLLRYLWALPPFGPAGTGWPLGRTLDVPELRTAAGRTPGVLSVGGLRLYRRGEAGWTEVTAGSLPLPPWGLPELAEVLVDSADPPAPPAIVSAAEPAGTPTPAPAPVAPDIC